MANSILAADRRSLKLSDKNYYHSLGLHLPPWMSSLDPFIELVNQSIIDLPPCSWIRKLIFNHPLHFDPQFWMVLRVQRTLPRRVIIGSRLLSNWVNGLFFRHDKWCWCRVAYLTTQLPLTFYPYIVNAKFLIVFFESKPFEGGPYLQNHTVAWKIDSI